eukprot:515366-Amphidinium_carterae.1
MFAPTALIGHQQFQDVRFLAKTNPLQHDQHPINRNAHAEQHRELISTALQPASQWEFSSNVSSLSSAGLV